MKGGKLNSKWRKPVLELPKRGSIVNAAKLEKLEEQIEKLMKQVGVPEEEKNKEYPPGDKIDRLLAKTKSTSKTLKQKSEISKASTESVPNQSTVPEPIKTKAISTETLKKRNQKISLFKKSLNDQSLKY